MKSSLFLLFFILLNCDLHACLNAYRTSLNGAVHYDDYAFGRISPEEIEPEWFKEDSAELIQQYRGQKANDAMIFGIQLMLLTLVFLLLLYWWRRRHN